MESCPGYCQVNQRFLNVWDQCGDFAIGSGFCDFCFDFREQGGTECCLNIEIFHLGDVPVHLQENQAGIIDVEDFIEGCGVRDDGSFALGIVRTIAEERERCHICFNEFEHGIQAIESIVFESGTE